MARSIVSCGHGNDTGEAFGCSRPLSGSRTATIGIVAWFRFCRPILVVGRYIGFAVVMAQVRRPVPFRTRKLRPGTAMVLHSRGCGRVARRRIQLMDLPVEPHRGSRKVLFYSRARVSSSIRWRFLDAGRTAGGMIPPPTGCFVPPEGPWAGGFLHPLGVPGRWGIPGISGELPALIRWWNRLGNYALFRTQTLRRIEQNHVSRQSDGPAGRRPEFA